MAPPVTGVQRALPHLLPPPQPRLPVFHQAVLLQQIEELLGICPHHVYKLLVLPSLHGVPLWIDDEPFTAQ